MHAALMRCVHSVLGFETDWRMKQVGEAIGPAEATQEMAGPHGVQRVGVALKPWVFSQYMT